MPKLNRQEVQLLYGIVDKMGLERAKLAQDLALLEAKLEGLNLAIEIMGIEDVDKPGEVQPSVPGSGGTAKE